MTTEEIVIDFDSVTADSLRDLVKGKKSFVVRVNEGELTRASARIEEACGDCQLRAWVFTEGRLGAAASGLWFAPNFLGAMVGRAVSNVVDQDPDYEIARNVSAGTVTVTYLR
ncbi:MAG: hypothetical protein LBR80_07950 [Deltaproteobacteria bacterium]|nr:hypothetical protein [Deltaproteobacteria bacterium]